MKFSEQWLRSWVNPAVSRDELVARLSMTGLEVDSVTPAAGEFSGVVVGEILSAEQHPDADKLRVCRVSSGSEEFQVVCGAPNARAGIRIPFAMVGAVLGEDFKIKKAKLRGVESFGMLCSAAELKLSDDHDGLFELPADAPVGQCLREYLGLDDAIIEVDLTPNRGDCLSIAGLAREVGANYAAQVTRPAIDAVAATHDETRPVELLAPAACSRYVGRVIRNVDLSRATPLWMVERLRRSDIRSIDPVVDITNYVMLELGQPLHAFDLAEIRGGIRVRLAEEGEKLTLLDGQEITLRSDTLVIADHERPLAMAGILVIAAWLTIRARKQGKSWWQATGHWLVVALSAGAAIAAEFYEKLPYPEFLLYAISAVAQVVLAVVLMQRVWVLSKQYISQQ